MKPIGVILILSCMLTGCVGALEPENSFDRVKVCFKSSDVAVDLSGITGLDMGPMYSPESYTPKFVGDVKYTSYHDVKLAQELVVRWRISDGDQANAFEQVVKRPQDIPETIPREHMVIFQYSGGQWTIMMKPLE